MKFVIAVVMALGLAAGAREAHAQVQPPQDRIDTALARARQVGAPVALLESKIAEGKAKGVPIDRIATAVERREAALERAGQVMNGQETASEAELGLAADAIESGVSDAVLKAVSETAPRDRRAVAIAALTQLVLLGHVPEAALARVQEALKRGPQALLNLPAEAGGRGVPSTVQLPNAATGRGGAPGAGGPPASVPAPGGGTQPTRPGGPPANPGSSAAPGAGRGGA